MKALHLVLLAVAGTVTAAEPAQRTLGPGRRLTAGDHREGSLAILLEHLRAGRRNSAVWSGEALTIVLRELAHVDLERGHTLESGAVYSLVFRRPGGVRFVPCVGPVPVLRWPGRVSLPQYARGRAAIEEALVNGGDAGAKVRALRREYVLDHPKSVRFKSVETWRAYNAGLRAIDECRRNIELATLDPYGSTEPVPCLEGDDLVDLVEFTRKYKLNCCGAGEDAAMAEVFDVALAAWIEHRGEENAGRVEAYRAAKESEREAARQRAIDARRAFLEQRSRRQAAQRIEFQRRAALAAARVDAVGRQPSQVRGSNARTTSYWYSVPVPVGGSTVHLGGPVRTSTTRTIRIR